MPGVDEVAQSEEVVEGLPVVRRSTAIERAGVAVPARQAAALTATGFVAGIATAAMVSRRRSRWRLRRSRRRNGPLGEILASNSFLVDVHLIKRH